ncbi:TPA: hypothetical protein QHT56_004328 [Enterobacter hormaechei subsp. steigerwaltii]|nr:hypothetical protein [Enterobacter hormaechei subsp. steigerwaltii]
MELLTQLLNALWAQDFETLANPSMIGMLYFVLFMILFLENGLLPAAFLPGDSLLGRFIAFVRTLLPTIAGLSGLSSTRFQFFNWMSGLLWVLILTTLGYALGKTPVFMKYEDQLMSCLMLLPVVLLVFGLVGSLVVLWKKKYGARG